MDGKSGAMSGAFIKQYGVIAFILPNGIALPRQVHSDPAGRDSSETHPPPQQCSLGRGQRFKDRGWTRVLTVAFGFLHAPAHAPPDGSCTRPTCPTGTLLPNAELLGTAPPAPRDHPEVRGGEPTDHAPRFAEACRREGQPASEGHGRALPSGNRSLPWSRGPSPGGLPCQ